MIVVGGQSIGYSFGVTRSSKGIYDVCHVEARECVQFAALALKISSI